MAECQLTNLSLPHRHREQAPSHIFKPSPTASQFHDTPRYKSHTLFTIQSV
ncbi:hypothetical protein [Pseudomonas sp. 44 R 15]|nr:hypothetical protein [Pseudomonas sp. 44 R 15]